MAQLEFEPLARKAQADLIIERAAEQLRPIVKDLASRLDPFPPFPGAFFSYGIEVEPDAAATTDRGCVVVAPDGELYELQIGVDFEGLDPSGYADPVAMRKEELKKLDDLHPRDYIVYAYNAIAKIVEILLERQEPGEGHYPPHSSTMSPLFPPCFSTSRTASTRIPRSTALHMS